MLKIKSNEGEVSVKVNGSVQLILTDLICGIRGLAESLEEEDKEGYMVMKEFFKQNSDEFYRMIFEPEKFDFEKERRKLVVNKIVKMAEEALVDDEDDDVGKKLVDIIREIAEQSFGGDDSDD